VKNALLLLADTSGVFEKLLLRRTFPDGGRSKPDKPCIGRHPEKGCKARKAKAREAINPMPNRG
jgi:hypothetical protein